FGTNTGPQGLITIEHDQFAGPHAERMDLPGDERGQGGEEKFIRRRFAGGGTFRGRAGGEKWSPIRGGHPRKVSAVPKLGQQLRFGPGQERGGNRAGDGGTKTNEEGSRRSAEGGPQRCDEVLDGILEPGFEVISSAQPILEANQD